MNPYAKCKTGKQNRNERNKRKDVTSNTYVLKSIFDCIKIYGIKIDMVSNIGLETYLHNGERNNGGRPKRTCNVGLCLNESIRKM